MRDAITSGDRAEAAMGLKNLHQLVLMTKAIYEMWSSFVFFAVEF